MKMRYLKLWFWRYRYPFYIALSSLGCNCQWKLAYIHKWWYLHPFIRFSSAHLFILSHFSKNLQLSPPLSHSCDWEFLHPKAPRASLSNKRPLLFLHLQTSLLIHGISDFFSLQLKIPASVFCNFFSLYAFWQPQKHVISTFFYLFFSLFSFASHIRALFECSHSSVTQTYQCWRIISIAILIAGPYGHHLSRC